MARNIRGTKQILSLSLDVELVKRVDNLADANGMSRSAMVESFIESGIDQEELKIRAFTNPVLREALMKSFSSPSVVKALLKGMKDEVTPQDMQLFQQGMQMMDNFSEEYNRNLPPEVIAKKAMKKTISENKKRRRGHKPKT